MTSLTLLVIQQASTVSTTSLWLYLVLGIVTVGTLLWGGIKLIRQQGAEEVHKKDRENTLDVSVQSLKDSVAKLEGNFSSIEKSLKPNGLNTERLGDIAKRTENAVGELTSKLDQHIGAERRDREDIWNAIHDIQHPPAHNE